MAEPRGFVRENHEPDAGPRLSLAERVRRVEDAAHAEGVEVDMLLVFRGGAVSLFTPSTDLADGAKVLRRLGVAEVRSSTTFGPFIEGVTEAGSVAVYPRMPSRLTDE